MLKIKNISITKYLFVILILVTFYNFFNSLKITNSNVDITVIFTFFLIFCVTMVGIIRDKRPFSLNKTYWYFNLVFFVMAPLSQYLSNYHVWRVEISNKVYFFTNLLILIGNIIHLAIYKKNDDVNFWEYKGKNNKKLYYFLLTLALLSFVLLVMNVGFKNLFLRSTNVSEFSDSKMFNTIITCFLKAFPVYCFTIAFMDNPKISIKNSILIIIVFLMNYPISTTRFWMGAILIGIVLLVGVKKKNQNRIQDIIFLLVFTIIFPITYWFHFYSLDYVFKNGMGQLDLASSYLSVDYDAYSVFARIVNYVNINGAVWGKQLIGTVLFMIPRAIWPNKPQATGAFIATVTNQEYTNISSPFMSEGYINFGILGLIAFEVILAIVSRKLDNNYWSKNKNKYVFFVYPYFIGLLLFYERGALHHAVVYTFCFMLPLMLKWIIDLLVKSVIRKKENKE